MRGAACVAAIVLAMAVVGCVNKPGSLRLDLRSAQADYQPDEGIELDLRMRAEGSDVCLSRYGYFRITMTPLESGVAFVGDDRPFLCGTGVAVMLPLYPFVAIVSLLDIADRQGRYEMLRDGDTLDERRLVLARSRTGESWGELHVARSTLGIDAATSQERPLPGEYRLRAEFVNEAGGLFPGPLFRFPYPHPVHADTVIRIRDNDRSVTHARP